MSVQPPPTNTTTPVYNPIFFIDPASSSGITIPFLDANYLKFPTAQGSEDFTNGLFSTDTIDFNSATGANRAITNLSTSSFSDILGNATYTASIEENSTAIGTYDGGLVITSSNTINLVGADVLLNGVPITTGGGDVFLAGNNTFTGANTFNSTFSVDNTQTNIGQLPTGNNTAIGLATLGDIIIGGDNNSAFGYTALQALTSGSFNTGLGYASLANSLTDDNNTAVGYWSGQQLNGGSNNTYLGYESGYNQTTGSGNVAIGYQTGVNATATTLSNTIAIGKGITSVATGDMIFGFSQFSPPNDYWAKFTPNNTFGGITLQGTNLGSSNFTIDATGSSVALNSTNIYLNATNTANITNILQSPNNPNINVLSSGQGTFYISSQNPYFAYNNAGVTTSQQLVNTTTLSTYAPINSPNFTGTPTAPTATFPDSSTQIATTAYVSTAISNISNPIVTTQFTCSQVSFNSQWSGYIPLNITMNSFTFLFYTNNPSTSPTLTSGFPLTSNNTQFSGFGTATRQNYTSNGNSQYGYIFTILNYYGAPNPSPNLTMYSVVLNAPSPSGCCFVEITGLIDNAYYYNLLNNNLTLIITKWN